MILNYTFDLWDCGWFEMLKRCLCSLKQCDAKRKRCGKYMQSQYTMLSLRGAGVMDRKDKGENWINWRHWELRANNKEKRRISYNARWMSDHPMEQAAHVIDINISCHPHCWPASSIVEFPSPSPQSTSLVNQLWPSTCQYQPIRMHRDTPWWNWIKIQ